MIFDNVKLTVLNYDEFLRRALPYPPPRSSNFRSASDVLVEQKRGPRRHCATERGIASCPVGDAERQMRDRPASVTLFGGRCCPLWRARHIAKSSGVGHRLARLLQCDCAASVRREFRRPAASLLIPRRESACRD